MAREFSPAMKRQQAKMKAAWAEVRKAGLKGKAAFAKVRSLLKGDTGASTKVPRKARRGGPKAPTRRARSARRQRGPRSTPRLGYRDIPFMMKAEDIAGGEYRDAAQETPHATFASGGDLQTMTQGVKTSQQGLRPNLRPYWKTRLYLATGVMSGGGQDSYCYYSLLSF